VVDLTCAHFTFMFNIFPHSPSHTRIAFTHYNAHTSCFPATYHTPPPPFSPPILAPPPPPPQVTSADPESFRCRWCAGPEAVAAHQTDDIFVNSVSSGAMAAVKNYERAAAAAFPPARGKQVRHEGGAQRVACQSLCTCTCVQPPTTACGPNPFPPRASSCAWGSSWLWSGRCSWPNCWSIFTCMLRGRAALSSR
jgi:hypothetical protein